MKRQAVVICCLLLASCGSPTATNSTKTSPENAEAIKVLQDLTDRTQSQSGINFQDYSQKVADAEIVVNKSSDEKLKAAIATHIAAAKFWECEIRSSSDGTLRQCQTQQLQEMEGVHKAVDPYIAELKRKVPEGYAFNNVEKEKVIPPLWEEARAELEAAKKQ